MSERWSHWTGTPRQIMKSTEAANCCQFSQELGLMLPMHNLGRPSRTPFYMPTACCFRSLVTLNALHLVNSSSTSLDDSTRVSSSPVNAAQRKSLGSLSPPFFIPHSPPSSPPPIPLKTPTPPHSPYSHSTATASSSASPSMARPRPHACASL